MIFALVAMLLAMTGGYWLISWFHGRPSKPELYEIYLNQLLKKLQNLDLEKSPSEDTRAFLQRIKSRGFREWSQVAKIIELYNLIKYGPDNSNAQSLNNLRSLVHSIRI